MEDFITIENLIEEAIKHGVNFGKGDPYNRLRYYTKIGLLPHMVRKVVNGEVIGHYPAGTLDLLLEIEKLKSLGMNNNDIMKKIKTLNHQTDAKVIKVARILTPTPKLIKLSLLVLFILMILAGFGVIPIGKNKSDLIQKTLELDKKFLLDSGTAYVPRNQNKVYVKSTNVKQNSKINITFTSDYTPASRYWVSKKVPFEGFYLELDAPASMDSEFNWWISN